MIMKQDYKANEEDIGPTVVFCNPNAGYYEYAYAFQEQWIEFYTTRGMNLFLWNYRGYGRSEGYPTPANLLLDGEQVVKYLREVRGVKKLIIHGESLGGAVAVHLARKCGCEFLFADRTFCDLNKVSEAKAGPFLTQLLRIITRWDLVSTHNFILSPCYKIVANDPSDIMIHEISSLKSGISMELLNHYNEEGYILNKKEIEIFYQNINNIKNATNVIKHDITNIKVKTIDIRKNQDNEQMANSVLNNEVLLNMEHTKEFKTEVEATPKEINNKLLIDPKTKEAEKNEEISELNSLITKILLEFDKIEAAGISFGKILKDNSKFTYMELIKVCSSNININSVLL